MDANWVGVAGAFALVALIVYRRLMRLFARRLYRAPRVLIVTGFFGLLTLLMLPLLSVASGSAPAGGTALGLALGWFGYRLTKFEESGDEIFFTPDPYIGAIIFTMFIGRLAYRAVSLRNVSELAINGANGGPGPTGLGRSPLTAALLLLLLGYYVSYYFCIWLHARRLTRPEVRG